MFKQMEFPNPYSQHIFGIVDHGRGVYLYRSFPHLKTDTNLSIHAFLLHFQRRLTDFKFIPPTVYIQIDGGPDLANKTFYAIMSLLVARRVGGIRRIVITRLLVGHTHEVYFLIYYSCHNILSYYFSYFLGL